MNLRSIFVGVAVLSATLVLAAGVLQFAEGRGNARSEDGRRAGFHFNARKLTNGEQVRKSGTAVFEISDRETLDGVRINMRELRDINVDGHFARFEGPGGIRFRTRRGVVERQGQVFVSARDNRKPDGPVEPRDRVSVRFVAREGNLTYAFEGVVGDGDVAVGRREVD
ncbi:MAG: hypothetical protein H7Y17_10290 [Chlorobia bacterium]|nr:hypothetical protein [Fimbriimonadaceae bacterium]